MTSPRVADRAIEPREEELLVYQRKNAALSRSENIHVDDLLKLTLLEQRQKGSCNIVYSKDIYIQCFHEIRPSKELAPHVYGRHRALEYTHFWYAAFSLAWNASVVDENIESLATKGLSNTFSCLLRNLLGGNLKWDEFYAASGLQDDVLESGTLRTSGSEHFSNFRSIFAS